MSTPNTDDQLRETITKLVDEAMQAAASRSAFTAVWHNPDYWYRVRDQTADSVMLAVDLARPAPG